MSYTLTGSTIMPQRRPTTASPKPPAWFAWPAWCLAVWLLAPTTAALAQPAATEPEAAAEFRRTYQQLPAGRFELDFVRIERDGVWTLRQAATMTLAFDRSANRWRLSHPDFELQIDGDLLRLKSERFPGRHLETPIAEPTTYEQLTQQVGAVHDAMLVPTVLLMARDVWPTMVSTTNYSIETLGPPDPGLRINRVDGHWLFEHDAQFRLTRAAWAAHNTVPRGEQSVAEMIQDMTWTHWDTLPPEEAFAFDTTNSTAVATLRELVSPGSGSPGNSQTAGGGTQAPGFTLTGMDGTKISTDTLHTGVVVLDFWATWADPSVGRT